MPNILINKILIIFSLLFLSGFCTQLQAQNEGYSMYIERNSRNSVRIPFKTVNNLMLIPLQINNSDTLRFILDTGVKTALITELNYTNSVIIKNAYKVKVYGLGRDSSLEAYASINNAINLSGIVGKNQKIHVLINDIFHLSTKMGTNIHGLIGYEIFRNFIVEIDYYHQEIEFHEPDSYRYNRWDRQAVTLPLTIERYKPYVETKVKMENGVIIPVKLLVDTGASDALWLFEHTHPGLIAPENTLTSFLGRGLGGDIYGQKGRIETLYIGHYELENPTVSFPDSAYVNSMMMVEERNGSLGAEIFRRFKVVIDYPHQRITFRPNRNFGEPFHYDMSGLDVATPIPDWPLYTISNVREGSPADKAGLMKNDQILSINGSAVSRYTLSEINELFRSREGRKIRIKVQRNDEKLKFQFFLKKDI